MKIHIYHHFEDCDTQKQLDRIEKKIDLLLSQQTDNAAIAKAASDLDVSTNQLKDAVDKNTPAT
jgi:predicted Zn-dependent protease